MRVGTSGWHYAHWRGRIYPPTLPPRDWLSHYAGQLDSVEVNNSFYRLPEANTLAEWAERTPTDFEFALKAPRGITHLRKLGGRREPLDTFLARAALLGNKCGPLLFQLPPHWHCNTTRLASFLRQLPTGHQRVAFEFRDPSWHNDEVYALLAEHGAAFCIYHLAGQTSPRVLTADFVYLRLHGPAGAYAGRYHPRTLQHWAGQISDWRQQGHAVYVYFNNDEAGYAFRNACQLRDLLAADAASGTRTKRRASREPRDRRKLGQASG